MIQGKNKKLITFKDKSFSAHAKKQREIWLYPCLYNTNHMLLKNENRTKFSFLVFQLLLYELNIWRNITSPGSNTTGIC